MAIKTTFVKKGQWRTIEEVSNDSGTGFFLYPPGASIRVRYGGDSWWHGFSRQEQKLTGRQWKKLCIGGIGIIDRARIQISVMEDIDVTYQIYPVAVSAPELLA